MSENNKAVYMVKNDELYHYGVVGMKWGVRKDPERAYSRAVRQLETYSRRATRGQAKATDRNRYKQAKYQRKATKYQLKSAKIRAKANRRFMPMNATKAAKKMIKYDRKAARYADKSAKMAKKIARGAAASERNIKKGKRLYTAMQKTFKDVPASKLNSADVEKGRALAKKYGWG